MKAQLTASDEAVIEEVRRLKLANPSDHRVVGWALHDYEERGEMFESTMKWFHALLKRGGARYVAALMVLATLSSCVYADKSRIVSLGGSSSYKSREFGLVHNHDESFRNAAALAALGVGAWQSVASSRAAEATSQAASANATKQAVNASNNATAVQQAAIQADVTKSTFVPP